jgi:diguanylate cyclase (GGDEF)-like protein/PAS domain S-box-containing protein
MNLVDMKTLVLNQALTYAICTIVVGLLWKQNRHRFPGVGFWLAGFAAQTISMMLIILRGMIPDWLSIVIGGNGLPIGGTILLYIGLEHFLGRRSRQIHNIALLAVSMFIHGYFAFVQPSLAARNINLSAFAILFYLQIAWLMLRRADTHMRPITTHTGWVFIALAFMSAARIFVNLTEPAGNDLLKANSTFDAVLILSYQIFFFAIAFGLFLMVNQRLFWELREQQIAVQKSEACYRDLVEFSPDAIFVYHDGRFDFVNSAALSLMRADNPERLLEKSVMEIVHPDYRSIASKRIRDVLARGEAAPLLEEKFIRVDGSIIDVEVITVPFDYQGQPALQTIARDITGRKRAEAVLLLRLKLLEFASDHSLEELMRRALDEIGELTGSPIGFYHFVEADQKTLSLQAWSTRTLREFCHAEGAGMHYDMEQAGVWVECVHERKPVIHNDYSALPASRRKGLPAGHAEVLRELVVPTIINVDVVSILGIGNKPSDYDESDILTVSYVADVIWGIVERKRDESQLRAYQGRLEAQNLELRKLSLAIEQSGNTIVITDERGAIQYANLRFEQTTGYLLGEVKGQNPSILKSGSHGEDFYRDLWKTILGGQIWRSEIQNRRKDGTLYWEATTIAPVQDDNGRVTNYIAIKEDVTERKQMVANLERLATADSLTGALNRHKLTATADHELERARRYNHPLSIIMLDIDHFKQINDQYGHAVGDFAIQKTAQTLLENLRGIDYLGRYGGDEFVVILPETDVTEAEKVAERIRLTFDGQSFQCGDQVVRISVSMGLACISCTADEPALNFDAAVQLADKALYAAKTAGRNCVRVYDKVFAN